MSRFFYTTIFIFTAVLTSSIPGVAQDNSGEAQYVYRPFDSDFAKRMDARESTTDESPSSSAVYSSYDDGWLDIKHPDFSVDGPWITQIQISSPYGRRVLSMIDHAAYQTTAWWVTDKLVAVRIWWGRLVGTIAIYDIENNSWPYREMFSPGSLLSQLSTGDSSEDSGELPASEPFALEMLRGPFGSRPAMKLRIDSESSSIEMIDAPSCSATIDEADSVALRRAAGALLADRAIKSPVCKPGPCASCTQWSVEVLSTSTTEMYSQRSSCLATDPSFRKLILQIEAVAAKHLSERCFTADENLQNKKKG